MVKNHDLAEHLADTANVNLVMHDWEFLLDRVSSTVCALHGWCNVQVSVLRPRRDHRLIVREDFILGNFRIPHAHRPLSGSCSLFGRQNPV